MPSLGQELVLGSSSPLSISNGGLHVREPAYKSPPVSGTPSLGCVRTSHVIRKKDAPRLVIASSRPPFPATPFPTLSVADTSAYFFCESLGQMAEFYPAYTEGGPAWALDLSAVDPTYAMAFFTWVSMQVQYTVE